MDIKEKIKNLPDSPGVYLLKDKEGVVIYIGKASSLQKRVASHFRQRGLPKEELLRGKVTDIEYIVTSSQAEALLWEASLIKEKQPRYNIMYRDDKSYPFLKITTLEKFPRLFIGRGKKEGNILSYRNLNKSNSDSPYPSGKRLDQIGTNYDTTQPFEKRAVRRKIVHDPDKIGGVPIWYFGPYTNAGLLREALKIMRRIFPYRSCRNFPRQACLYYSLELCPAPCIGKISQEDYKKRIQEISLFLAGKREELEEQLQKDMQAKARDNKFEEAAKIRDQITALAQLKDLRFGKETVLSELQNQLKLSKLPQRIEAFDVSHISGREAVGTMVSFYQGIPDKNNYRRFKIKLKPGMDDFSMMREIVSRRYRRVKDENLTLPDVVLIDGGKGHLEAAYSELKKLGIDKLEIISLAKEEEHIYTLKRKIPFSLSQDSRILQFLQRIRDEAHRFAITYHKKLRKKSSIQSELDKVKGIGEKRKKALLEFFGSVDKIGQASIEELLRVKGMNRRVAIELIQDLRGH